MTFVIVVFVAGLAALAAQGGPQASGRTIWDGVYTEAQAERATATFNQSCGNCHSLTAQSGRSLVGERFWESYSQKTVADLLTYVGTSMPNGNGGSLPATTYNDLVALLLRANGFPAGATELAPATAAGVRIVPREGGGELPGNALARVVGCLRRDGADWTVTRATAPERVDRPGPGPQDAARPLGDRTFALKFVLTKLDTYMGQRVSVSGLLIGAGGANGINVTSVDRMAESCM